MRTLTRALLGAALAAPLPLFAQGVQVVSVDRVHVAGALGKLASFAAGLGGAKMHDIADTIDVMGNKMRTAADANATIVDLDSSRITQVDASNRTYFSYTFDEMKQGMQAAMAQADAERQQPVAQQQGKQSSDSKTKIDFKPSAAFEPTSDHSTVAGVDAVRDYITVTIESSATDSVSSQQLGTMVLLVDEWRSTSATEGKQVADFQRAYAQRLGDALSAPLKSMQAAFSQDNRIKAGMDAAAKAMQNVQGMALETTTYVTIVPAGMTFNRALALGQAADTSVAPKPEAKKQGGFSGFMNRVKAAADAANKKADTTSAPPQQATLMTMTHEVLSMQSMAIPATLFAPPAGYTNTRTLK